MRAGRLGYHVLLALKSLPGVFMHGAEHDPNASMLILPGRAAIILTDAQRKHLDLAP